MGLIRSTWASKESTHQLPFRFLDLPSELRNNIYDILISAVYARKTDEATYAWQEKDFWGECIMNNKKTLWLRGNFDCTVTQTVLYEPGSRDTQLPGIMQACRQLRAEFLSAFWGWNSYSFEIEVRRGTLVSQAFQRVDPPFGSLVTLWEDGRRPSKFPFGIRRRFTAPDFRSVWMRSLRNCSLSVQVDWDGCIVVEQRPFRYRSLALEPYFRNLHATLSVVTDMWGVDVRIFVCGPLGLDMEWALDVIAPLKHLKGIRRVRIAASGVADYRKL